ncbi:MAG: aminomethyl-transferring glycine dehydrogenase subunit GcvPA, partial [Halobacteriaceae archaeon]
PYAPHTDEETASMLDSIGVDDVEELFDIPDSIAFDGTFDIQKRTEREVQTAVRRTLNKNDDVVEFLGRGHYDHYVPAIVDHIGQRSEFITSYTQYQPEITQGFLQALFEYQSLVVELTGLEIANCSMYDVATAIGEAARLALRVRKASGSTILVPADIRDERRSVLENYIAGTSANVDTIPMDGGVVNVDELSKMVSEDVVMIYVESPTTRGIIERQLSEIGEIATSADALFCLGSDPVALSILQRPADVGADIVVGDAVLGMGTAYGMGLGLFATREEFLRQVPGRLVGAGSESNGRRAFTLTLQTREQHIRRERATSNICTNQAWVALRAAIHATSLGPAGLVDLANKCVDLPRKLSQEIDQIDGFRAPIHDEHHFREFQVRTDQPARAVGNDLLDRGYAVHVVDEHRLQVCITETNARQKDGLVTAFQEVA